MLETIVRFGDPRLQTPCANVDFGDGQNLRDAAKQLTATLHAFHNHHGWGRAISAPQIGIMKRMMALHWQGQDFILINPRITWAADSKTELWDDCMSLPEITVRVLRHDSITVEYLDLDGQQQGFEKTDFTLSELLQHELDHLDGIIMTQRMIKGSAIVARLNKEVAQTSIQYT